MRIIFMGTPDFAVESLKKLVENKKNVVAVITAPDKPAGRGRKIQESAVKKYAVSRNIPVMQPPKLKNPEFIEELKSYKADLQIVVAFRMLPEMVWNMPKKGTFNLHASLLPQYRGAAPINWAIINGEKKTGVSTFFLQHEIDTGNLLFQESVDIQPQENVGTLHDKLMYLGGNLVLKTVAAIEKNNINPIKQDEIQAGTLKSAPKIFKDDCQIDWNKPARVIDCFIRGLSPYPAAWTTLKNKKTDEKFALKIFKIALNENNINSSDNKNLISQGGKLFAKAKDQYIEITDLQLSGKKRMNTKDFLNGFNPEEYCLG